MLNFTSPETLASHLHYLNQDDIAYSDMVVHKTKGIVDNTFLINAMAKRGWSAGNENEDPHSENFVEAFECYLCSEIHRKQREEKTGYSTRPISSIDSSHYSCSLPIHPVTRQENTESWWLEHWKHASVEANVIGRLVARNLNYTVDEFHQFVLKELAAVL